jgi:DNA modification methylase
MTVRIITGDCREVLATLPAESVHCVVTSPPYWGLRDYGVAGQIGLEGVPHEYVETMVAVFREVRRVLRADGTLWLNLGDSYANDGKWGGETGGKQHYLGEANRQRVGREKRVTGLKPKDLVGIPWRVAFALQADGWVLRQEIVWAKPNPMPESVRDRCTKSHEQIFLFAKARWSGPAPGRYAHIREQDARWLAMFFDTEGNLCLRREKGTGGDYGAHSAQIVLANSHRPLLEAAANIVGDGSILERRGTNAPMYYWQVCGKKAADLLAVIYPHLIAKQRQARCLLHLEARKEVRGGHVRLTADEIAYRDRLWAVVKDMNHFGQPDISWVPEPVFGRWADCERYYFDQEAIAEPCSPNTHARLSQDVQAQIGSERAHAGGKTNGNMKAVGRKAKSGTYSEDSGRFDSNPHPSGGWPPRKMAAAGSGIKNNDSMDAALAIMPEKRNKRSVWEVTTRPFSEAHFATFPPALIEPCILAGCPNGGVVLDPFGGAGTTGLVADRHQRNAILIELNPEYAAMARRRIDGDTPLFSGTPFAQPAHSEGRESTQSTTSDTQGNAFVMREATGEIT